MKKRFATIIVVISFFRVSAEEGMLIPSLIMAFENDMKAMGMRLSADDIYSVNQSSLKDAILHFGGGCTAELVSSQGLLLTNHHCGYSQVQSHSSLENDYIKNGFWARSMSEELTNPGLTASRIVRIQDVTATMFQGTEGLSGEEYSAKVQANMETLIADARAGNHYEAEIKAFNYGNDYYMIVKETFKDVRLVGAPPSSIGKFGGDTDNWVWPRHTGDFSMFRIYVGADNKPADYNPDNKPYEPLRFFEISTKDRIPGEFTMVYGFPGTTEQHVSSDHLEYIMNTERPARIAMRDKSLAVIGTSMNSSDLLRIQYASKQARIANAWKKWIGQIGGLQSVKAIETKRSREKAYNDMAATRPEWKSKYGGVVKDLNNLVTEFKDKDFAYAMYIEYLYVGPEMYKRARELQEFLTGYESMDEATRADELEKLRKGGEGFFKDFDRETDRKIFVVLSEEYMKQQPNSRLDQFLGDRSLEEVSQEIYSTSIMGNKENFDAFLNHINDSIVQYILDNDEGYVLWKALNDDFFTNVIPEVRIFEQAKNELLSIYVEGKMEMFPDDKHWPDANSTMRITYGKLEGSAPHDGMKYTEHTTLDGILAKNNTGNPDFEITGRLRKLAEAREYGEYDQNGELWVCFTGSNHTTGGNSGSPVIDADGLLMGVNFDRSWESTMSDFMFDASRCRNITVDIRYVLWVIDKYAGAGHLVEEMTLVDESQKAYKKRKKRFAKLNTCDGDCCK